MYDFDYFTHHITNNHTQPDATIELIKKSLYPFSKEGCSDFIGF